MYILTMEQGRGSQAEHISLTELKDRDCSSGEAGASGSSVGWSYGKVGAMLKKNCSRNILRVPLNLC